MAITDPNRLDQYLNGVQFPAEKKKLVSEVQSSGAPFEISYALEQLPEKQFGSLDEVKSEVARID